MVSIRLSELVKAPPEKVFSFMSDFEKAPQYSKYWKSVKLLSREGNVATYQTEAEVQGMKIRSVTRITARPNESFEAEAIDGDGKGTRMTSRFQGAPGGTQLTLEGDIVLTGVAKIFGGLAKGRIESSMREELEIVKRTVEKP